VVESVHSTGVQEFLGSILSTETRRRKRTSRQQNKTKLKNRYIGAESIFMRGFFICDFLGGEGVALGFELRASCLLGRCSMLKACLQPCIRLVGLFFKYQKCSSYLLN
jgi:hypothetical protein